MRFGLIWLNWKQHLEYAQTEQTDPNTFSTFFLPHRPPLPTESFALSFYEYHPNKLDLVSVSIKFSVRPLKSVLVFAPVPLPRRRLSPSAPLIRFSSHPKQTLQTILKLYYNDSIPFMATKVGVVCLFFFTFWSVGRSLGTPRHRTKVRAPICISVLFGGARAWKPMQRYATTRFLFFGWSDVSTHTDHFARVCVSLICTGTSFISNAIYLPFHSKQNQTEKAS